MNDFLQLTANGLFRGMSYAAMGAGLALILGVTGRFHFSYALHLHHRPARRLRGGRLGEAAVLAGGGHRCAGRIASVSRSRSSSTARCPRARDPTPFWRSWSVPSASASSASPILQLLLGTGSVPFYGPDLSAIDLGPIIFTNFDVFQAISALRPRPRARPAPRRTPLGRSIKATRSNPAGRRPRHQRQPHQHRGLRHRRAHHRRLRHLVRPPVHGRTDHGRPVDHLRLRGRLPGRYPLQPAAHPGGQASSSA